MAGRPKRTFSEHEIAEIERLAQINCNTNTIATVLDIPFKTLQRHFAKTLKKGWAQNRVNLRESQEKLKETSADMAKFLGKNELGQVDKQELTTNPAQPPIVMSDAEKALIHEFIEYKDRAAKLKLRPAEGS